MLTVGLTGNVAGGKTTVADRWRDAGVVVIDADRIGHEVLEGDPAVQEALVREFGGGILDYDGAIDRDALGAKAFATDEGIRRLNAIVHPPLLERLDHEIERRAAEHDLVAVDAALIYEFHLEETLDQVVVVTASRETRARRLARHRGMDPARIERIMAAQLPDEEKLEEADYVIVNEGSLDDLREEADRVLSAIRMEIEDTEEE